MTAGNQDPVPRLPRSRGFKLTIFQVVRIATTALILALIIVIRRPCSDTVSKFVTSFGGSDSGSGSGSASTKMPTPGTVERPNGVGSAGDYEQLRSDMTEAELKAAIERAKLKAAQRAGSGSAEGSSAEGGTAESGSDSGSSAGSAGSGGSRP